MEQLGGGSVGGQVHRARANSSSPVRIDLCPECAADKLREAEAEDFGAQRRRLEMDFLSSRHVTKYSLGKSEF